MAVIRSNYIEGATRAERGERAKDHLRYIQHRPGHNGEKIKRELFGFDGEIDKLEAYEMIDRAKKGTILYRISLNPDPSREDGKKDLDLKKMALETMQKLEEKLGRKLEFIAAIHADHTDRRHVSLLAFMPRKLYRRDLYAFRQSLNAEIYGQRKELDGGLKKNWQTIRQLNKKLGRKMKKEHAGQEMELQRGKKIQTASGGGRVGGKQQDCCPICGREYCEHTEDDKDLF